ncbi:hypothetical protein ABK040_005078 [Willaertia magna]
MLNKEINITKKSNIHSNNSETFQYEYDRIIDFKIVNEDNEMMDLENNFTDKQKTFYAVGYIIKSDEKSTTLEGKEKQKFGPIYEWKRDYSPFYEKRPCIIIRKEIGDNNFHELECCQPSDEYLTIYNKVYLKICLVYHLMNVVMNFPNLSFLEIISKVPLLDIPSKGGKIVKQKVTKELIIEYKHFIKHQFRNIAKANDFSSLTSSLFMRELNGFKSNQITGDKEERSLKRKEREELKVILNNNNEMNSVKEEDFSIKKEEFKLDSEFKSTTKGKEESSLLNSSSNNGRERVKKQQVTVNRYLLINRECDETELKTNTNNNVGTVTTTINNNNNQSEEKKKRGRGRPRKDGSDPQPRKINSNIRSTTDRNDKVITWTSESTDLDESGRVYFTSCKVNDWELKIGDSCYLLPPDRYRYGYPYHVLLIDALFEDWKGVKFVRGRFLLRYHDIVNILQQGEELNILCKDPQELFLTETIDDNPLDAVMGKCVVFFLRDSQDFTKIDYIRQTRDTFYCTKKFIIRDRFQFGLFKLSREEIKLTFSTLEDNANFLLNQFRKDKPKLIALDIFSGCGGLSLGLHRAGIEVKYCIEFWEQAAETYRQNFKEAKVFCDNADTLLQKIKAVNRLKEKYKVNDSLKKPSTFQGNNIMIEKIKWTKEKLTFYVNTNGCCAWYDECELNHEMIVDVLVKKYSDYPKPGAIDLICGGPPCQGFSGLNRFKEKNSLEFMNHEKNRLMKTFLKYVNYFKPKYVLIENVSGLLNSSIFNVPKYIITTLNTYGYKTHYACLNALHYGLPQSRTRVFFLACKQQDGVLPDFPEHTHAARRMGLMISSQHKKELVKHPHKVIGGFLPEITNRDIICDLNKFELPNLGENETIYENPPLTIYQEEFRKNSTILHNHISKGFGVVFTSLIKSMPKRPGANYNDLIEGAKPLLKEGYLNYRKGSKHILGRMMWSSRFYTIVTSVNPLSQTALHPNQNRVYSCRECCRAQGFPDDFIVTGTDTDIYKQIGNAVPVNVAKCIGDEIIKAEMKYIKQNFPNKLNDKLELENLILHFNNSFKKTKEWLDDEKLTEKSEPLMEELFSYTRPLTYDLCDSVTLPKTRKDVLFEKNELPAIVKEHGDEIEIEIKASLVEEDEEEEEEEIVKELEGLTQEEEEELSEEEEEEEVFMTEDVPIEDNEENSQEIEIMTND